MHRVSIKCHIARRFALALSLIALAACEAEPTPPAPAAASNCVESGELSGEIFGSLEGHLNWQGSALSCAGMPRPNNAGARLRFSGMIDLGSDSRELALIIALPELERGATPLETPAKVTMIEEDTGRFFSTGDIDVCWSDILRQAPLAGDSYDIRGIVYCVSPLAELRGSGAVTFTELTYAGQVDWSGP